MTNKNLKKAILLGLIIIFILFSSYTLAKHNKKKTDISLSTNKSSKNLRKGAKKDSGSFTPLKIPSNEKQTKTVKKIKDDNDNQEINCEDYPEDEYDSDVDFKSDYDIHESYEHNEASNNNNNKGKQNSSSINNNSSSTSTTLTTNINDNNTNSGKYSITNSSDVHNKPTEKKKVKISLFQNCLEKLNNIYNYSKYDTDGYHADSWFQETWSMAYTGFGKDLKELCNKINSDNTKSADFKEAVNNYKKLYEDAVKLDSNGMTVNVNESNVKKCREILKKYKFGEYTDVDDDGVIGTLNFK